MIEGAVQVAEFVIPGEPVSKARARFTYYGSKIRSYTPAKTMEAERRIAAAYLAVAEPNADSDEAFGVHAEFLHQTGQRRDTDNMLKAVLDGLNGIAFPDDVQVTRIVALKRRVPKGEALTRVRVFTLGRIEKPRGRCQRCGAEFMQYASTSGRKFCSRECGYAWRRELRERTCKRCGVGFDHAHPSSAQRFCSRECARLAKHIETTCVRCGSAFSKPRSLNRTGNDYCSAHCKATFWREQRKAAAKGTCQDCAGPTTKKTYKRCRDCAYAAGGRWADRDDVTCPTCHQFVADGQQCPSHPDPLGERP